MSQSLGPIFMYFRDDFMDIFYILMWTLLGHLTLILPAYLTYKDY